MKGGFGEHSDDTAGGDGRDCGVGRLELGRPWSSGRRRRLHRRPYGRRSGTRCRRCGFLWRLDAEARRPGRLSVRGGPGRAGVRRRQRYRHPVQRRLNRQDVHRHGDPASGGTAAGRPGHPGPPLSARLPGPRHRRADHGATTAVAQLRRRQLLGGDRRKAVPGLRRDPRLPAFDRRPAAGVHARRAARLFQRRLCDPGPDRRGSHRRDLRRPHQAHDL